MSYTTTDGAQQTAAFVVQASREESPLAPMDQDTLSAWWKPASLTVTPVGPEGSGVQYASRRFSLAPWLVVLACMALLAEMLLVHKLCPAVNPTVATSFVSQHGIVRGVSAGTPVANGEPDSPTSNSAAAGADEPREPAAAQT